MRRPTRAYILVPLLVASLLTALGTIGAAGLRAAGLPLRLGLPEPLRWLGILVVVFGFLLLGWTLHHRRFRDVLTSTWLTMTRAVRGEITATAAGGGVGEATGATPGGGDHRPGCTEPLIASGPHAHVRHPLYAAALVLLVGWGLAVDLAFVMVAAALLWAWFRFMVIPREERELRSRFGERWDDYARRTPRLVPRPGRRPGAARSGGR